MARHRKGLAKIIQNKNFRVYYTDKEIYFSITFLRRIVRSETSSNI